ncbi:hypothetical protein ACRALDRAFT_211260 [Sodiomyces alcalophilus JCM 7366]|uniref:uncharacterized protein n=1 Tax=Sodiomyces alcalophilus JCM 7366 TaxID=591952 RepID=UPI0039B5F264
MPYNMAKPATFLSFSARHVPQPSTVDGFVLQRTLSEIHHFITKTLHGHSPSNRPMRKPSSYHGPVTVASLYRLTTYGTSSSPECFRFAPSRSHTRSYQAHAYVGNGQPDVLSM